MENNKSSPSKKINQEEYFSCGHRACQGCAEVLSLRLALKALGKDTIVAMATGCMEIVSTPFPFTAWNIPWIHIAFENTAAVASGIEAGIKILQKKGRMEKKHINVVGIAGDGGTADIGFQALSGALERRHNFVYICLDNEAYMNTGIQRSSSTPFGASTTTSPAGKYSMGQHTWKKNMPEIAVAHSIPYVATACPSYPYDLDKKVKKAASIEGPAYIHILSICPPGWRANSEDSIQLGKLAVKTGVFPLYEVENGKYRFTVNTPQLQPVADYLKLQGRFRHLTPDLTELIQKRVVEEYDKLEKKCESKSAA